jgi:hypothetical protein
MPQCHFGSILLGIIDVLPVIPVTSGDVLPLNGDGAGPRRAPALHITSAKRNCRPLRDIEAYRACLRRFGRPEGESALRGTSLVAVS